jgi:toxin ParE1/3/4
LIVRLTRTAQADVEKAATWYEGRKEGLGEKFLDRVLETLNRVADNPKGYAPVVKDVRMVNVRRFPYGLWFRVVPEDGSIVIACLHQKRDRVLAAERALGIIQMPDPPEYSVFENPALCISAPSAFLGEELLKIFIGGIGS